MRRIIGVGVFLFSMSAAAGEIEDLDLQPGHWYEVPNSVLADAEKKPEDYADFDGSSSADYDSFQRNAGVRAVVANWCGAAYDSHEDRLVVFGGGHNGYGGNEVYAFDLDTFTWERLTDPTVNPDRCVDENYDGTPTSRHSYGGMEYIESAGRMYQAGGAFDCAAGGGGMQTVWTFDFANNTWERMDQGGDPVDYHFEAKSVYDPETERVYFHAHGWFEYDYATNTVESRASFNNWTSMSMALDLEQRVVLEIGDDVALLYDLELDDRMGAELTADGTDVIRSHGNPGLRYDHVLQRVVAWVGGTNVYSLDLDNNQWETHPPADGNTVTPSDITAAGGTYGRFAYSQTHNIFVLLNDALANVYLYKLSDGDGTTPETTGSSGDDSGGPDTDSDGDSEGDGDGGDTTSGDASGTTAGSAGASTNGGGDDGTTAPGSGEGSAADEPGGTDEGCGCRSGAGHDTFALLALGLLGLARRRRRRYPGRTGS